MDHDTIAMSAPIARRPRQRLRAAVLALLSCAGGAAAAAQDPAPANGYSGVKLTKADSGEVVIAGVVADSPAATAGLQEDDVLLRVGDVAIRDVAGAVQAIGAHKPGDKIVFAIRRAGKPVDVTVTLGTRPVAAPPEPAQTAAGFAPEVKVHDEDYGVARSRFHTKLTRKVPSPQPWSPAKPPSGVDEIEYRSGELRLKAWISQPAAPARKQPAVLFLHGGFAFGYPDDWDASKPYRDAGFLVMTPLLRAENGQEGAFSFFYDEVDDALAAAECLRKLPGVDAERLFLAGPSAGGTVALLAAMTSKLFRAVASFSATPDQVVFCKHAKNAARDIPVDITDVRELEMRSPLAFAASLKCPARIYVGKDEVEFHAMTIATARVGRQRGRDVEAVIVEGDHESSVLPAVQASIEFFRRQ